MRWATVLALLLALVPFAGAAAAPHDLLAKGPRVGDAMPHDLSVADQTGALTDFDRLKGSRGMVLMFIRSLDW